MGLTDSTTNTNTPSAGTRPQRTGAQPKKTSGRRRSSPGRRSRKGRAEPTTTPTEPVIADDWEISRFKVPPAEGKTRFHDFDLPARLMHGIADIGFEYCTPIQAEILPGTLNGKDATGKAQTGTGKTAAFLIAIITRCLRQPLQGTRKPGTPRALILAPTRELVLQITAEARSLAMYCNLSIISVFGGMDYQKQRDQLGAGPIDMMIATPGRLLDFQRRRDIDLKKVEVLVIDEADRMLDMGFIPDIRKIVHSTPPKDQRQTLFFSATLTGAVTRLALQWTRDPVSVEIEPEQVAVETVEQVVYIVTQEEKFALLYNIIHRQALDQVLVFCNRRDEVRRLADLLTRYDIDCAILSGEVPQRKRISRLEGFKAGKIRVLVATDVAGRGIHIEGMKHVINFTLPQDPEDYVHRIGRTGRAGSTGTSISFADEMDAFHIPDIETFIEQELRCTAPDPEWLELPEVPPNKKRRSTQRKSRPASGAASTAAGKRRPRKKHTRRGSGPSRTAGRASQNRRG